RHGVVAGAATRLVEERLEGLHAGTPIIGAIAVVGFEEQRVAREEAEEHAAVIQADAAEHRFRRHVAELFELIEDERPEPVADPQRARARGARLLRSRHGDYHALAMNPLVRDFYGHQAW